MVRISGLRVREEFSVSRRKQSSSRKYNRRNVATAATTGVATVAAGYFAHQHGIDTSILHSEIVPQPPVSPELVDGMVVVNEGIRHGAPVVALGALGTALYFSISGRIGRKNRALNELSKTEYSGVDDIQGHDYGDSLVGKGKERVSRLRRGTGIAVLSIVLTGGVSGLEHEISTGPLRPIDAVASVVSPGASDYTLILQDKNNTFMDDSVIDSNQIDSLAKTGAQDDINVIPFNKRLMNINQKSALEVSLPDKVFTSLTDAEVDDSCDNVPAIVDDTVGAKVGETIDINGTTAQVVSVKEGIAQMNRSIAILSDTDMKNCLEGGTDTSYFGAFVTGADTERTKQLLDSANMNNLDVVTDHYFTGKNVDFWRNNGTPIILLLMGSIALLGGRASANERKDALQRNVKEIGIMQATGVDIDDIRSIENRRALDETFRATLIAAPMIPIAAAAFNAAESGLRIGAGPREIAIGSMITLGSKMIASRRAVKSFEKNMDLSQAVKG